jgi:hypothetical protein
LRRETQAYEEVRSDEFATKALRLTREGIPILAILEDSPCPIRLKRHVQELVTGSKVESGQCPSMSRLDYGAKRLVVRLCGERFQRWIAAETRQARKAGIDGLA